MRTGKMENGPVAVTDALRVEPLRTPPHSCRHGTRQEGPETPTSLGPQSSWCPKRPLTCHPLRVEGETSKDFYGTKGRPGVRPFYSKSKTPFPRPLSSSKEQGSGVGS